jgi:NCAIR mutase (PurE)-related protein
MTKDEDFLKGKGGFPDLERAERIGFAEVIFCPGKSPDQLRLLAPPLFETNHNVIATRATLEQAEVLKEIDASVCYNEIARVAYKQVDHSISGTGNVLVISAGSCDKPVAEEAACVATIMGNRVEQIEDVGVAGLHRIMRWENTMREAAAIIVVAGMEGALPSVVGGLVSCPVIAVPTSVGYGTSFSGLTPLLGMLNSCAPGLTVVNIDNGFGAAFAASRINHTIPAPSAE